MTDNGHNSKTVKILFTSDPHGSEVTFRKFLNAGMMYGVDVLVVGGDLAGKALVPILDLGGERYSVQDKEVGREGLEVVKKQLRDRGLYYVMCDRKELEELRLNKSALDDTFKQSLSGVLKNWVELAEKRYSNTGIKIYVNLGNDDPEYLADVLKGSSTMIRTEGDIVEINGHEMISFGYVNPTPWITPRELSEEEIYARVKQMADRIRAPESAIFNFHAPPYGTMLDIAPKITPDLKPVTKGATVLTEHVGSRSVLKIIQEVNPLIGVHGHIHESKGFDKVGRTFVLNPGSEYVNGILHAALLVLEKEAIAGYQFIIG